ncbi:MAG: molecular chaperone [Dehalococcoidia bacterium]
MLVTGMDRRGQRKARNTGGEEGLDLADVAQFRQAAYRLFSMLLLYPDAERLRSVAAVARKLKGHDDFLATFPFFIQWKYLLDTLRSLADLQPARVQEEYITLFIANPEYSPCLPYESAYIESGGATGWTAVRIEQEYAAAGFSISSSLNEVPDHVAVELEFMSLLCDQEASAWERKRLNNGVDGLKRQAAFLEGHLNRWFPALAGAVARRRSSGIYAAVTRAVQSFVAHDSDLLKALGERFELSADARLADLTSKTPQQGM